MMHEMLEEKKERFWEVYFFQKLARFRESAIS